MVRTFVQSYSRLIRIGVILVLSPLVLLACKGNATPKAETVKAQTATDTSGKQPDQSSEAQVTAAPAGIPLTPIDTAAYNEKLLFLAHNDSSSHFLIHRDYPLPGAILPFKRIVAYYGNLYSKNMGVLGEYPPSIMLAKLKAECKSWAAADPATPVLPALHYICVTAQGAPGKDGKYRARMPFKQIDSVLHMAASINAIVFLDVQVGLSNVEAEIPLLEKYLEMPNVHLGIDPEFSMKTGKKPGTVIGTMDASDINFVSEYLAKLVRAHNLPPKIFIVHRFTEKMVTNYKQIKLRPEVQMLMNMDGWGPVVLKTDSYKAYVANQPVQFTGFKLFYKNDIRKPGSKMLTPAQVLALKPSPIYIQYQ
jgi:hypothetical protein